MPTQISMNHKKIMDQKIFILSQDNHRLEDKIKIYQYEKEQFKKN